VTNHGLVFVFGVTFKHLRFKEELYSGESNVYSGRAVLLHTVICDFCCIDPTNSKTGNYVLRNLIYRFWRRPAKHKISLYKKWAKFIFQRYKSTQHRLQQIREIVYVIQGKVIYGFA